MGSDELWRYPTRTLLPVILRSIDCNRRPVDPSLKETRCHLLKTLDLCSLVGSFDEFLHGGDALLSGRRVACRGRDAARSSGTPYSPLWPQAQKTMTRRGLRNHG